MTEVRRANPSDFEAVLDTLVLSHLDYVWEQWAVPEDDRPGRLRTLNRLSLELLGFPNDEVWMTADAASVAFWLPPDVVVPDLEKARESDALTAEMLGDRWSQLAEVESLLERVRPRGSFVLATVGTLPGRRREGLATAVLTPMLERLDAEGHSATLETSTETNVQFYERLGFEVRHVFDQLPYGAPVTWAMCRRPTLPA